MTRGLFVPANWGARAPNGQLQTLPNAYGAELRCQYKRALDVLAGSALKPVSNGIGWLVRGLLSWL